jgi:hypothetical protein
MNGYAAISLTIERLIAEGVEAAPLLAVEREMIDMLVKAQAARREHEAGLRRLAADLMPKLGAQTAAERLGCHRSTIYRWARMAAEAA